MVTLQAGNAGSPLGLSLTSSTNPSSALSSQEFTQALSDAIAGTLERFGIDPKSVTLDLGSKAGLNLRQNDVSSQFSGTMSLVAAAPATDRATFITNSSAASVGFNALVPNNSPAQPTPASAPSTTVTEHWYASNPVDDAYWNKQPTAVQRLREIDDLGQRQALGAQLASQGYQIDVPVMVWGWDAGKTSALRQTFGYTWVPSALQQPVSAAPGLQGAGIVPYDPNNPPQGSIKV